MEKISKITMIIALVVLTVAVYFILLYKPYEFFYGYGFSGENDWFIVSKNDKNNIATIYKVNNNNFNIKFVSKGSIDVTFENDENVRVNITFSFDGKQVTTYINKNETL